MEEVNYGVDSYRKFSLECSDPITAENVIESKGLKCKREGDVLIVIADQPTMSEIVTTLVNTGVNVYSVTKIKRTLEDLYKEVSK